MANNKQETAEQKLLKMIESTSDSSKENVTAQQKIIKKKDLLTSIKVVNKILMLCILGVVIFVSIEIRTAMSTENNEIKINIKGISTGHVLNISDLITTPKRLAIYMSNIKRRNLFVPYEKKTVRKSANDSRNNSQIANFTSKYRLVGISWLNNIDSASAMLEDTEKNVTYFLQKGEKIGDIVVKTIYADSVELGYKSEEIIIGYDKSQM